MLPYVKHGRGLEDTRVGFSLGSQRCLRTVLLYGTARDHDDGVLPAGAVYLLPGHLFEAANARGHPETSILCHKTQPAPSWVGLEMLLRV